MREPFVIKMLSSQYGCDDGRIAKEYPAGEIFTVGQDIGESLACSFIARGQALETKHADRKGD